MSATAVHPPAHEHDHAHDHHELPFWQKYVFSTDHKVIGIQYGITALIFLAFGFIPDDGDALEHRLSRQATSPAWRGRSSTSSAATAPTAGCTMARSTGELYNMFGAMHGTIMVFLGIVPLGFAAFGNYVTPLQIGAVDMAFPRLNMASYWLFFIGGVLMWSASSSPPARPKSGWTNYSPLATSRRSRCRWHLLDRPDAVAAGDGASSSPRRCSAR